jgi:hypothetical protein
MAKHIIERLVDDIDGSEATQSISFEIDGRSYRIDLNDQHSAELRIKLAPFLEAARRMRHHTVEARSTATADKDRNSGIRRWALEEGVQLPGRGRIAGAVQAAYDAQDVNALYVATGLEREEVPAPKRSTKRRVSNASFSAPE